MITPASQKLDALIALAQREHQAGRLAKAAAAYREILAIQPDIAEAHNNLGNVLLSQGKLDEAVAEFERTVALRPDFAEAHNNLGFVFQWQGKLDEAAAQYERAATLKPDLFQVHNNLGNVLRQQGKLDQAAARYQRAIALRPDFAEAHNNLANVLLDQGRLDDAADHYLRALALMPDLADAHFNLGNVLVSQGKLDDAAARYERAIALMPDHAGAHYNLGNLLKDQGKLDEAAAQYDRAAALRPDLFQAHNNLGNILLQQGKLDQAAARYQRAIALRPDLAEAHNNLGNALRQQGKLDQALARHQQALALSPDLAEAHSNLGNVLLDLGKVDDAATHYKQALALRSDYADAQMGLAACYLIEEDYDRGWPAYEARLRIPGFVPRHSLRRWTGEPLAGCSLLLLSEQGLGDTLHFLRYARLLKQRGARVVLACEAALGRLLASHPDLDELFILGSAEELPPWDFYLPLLSAPGAFHTTASTIPGDVPYLSADPELTDKWRRELAGIDGFKIGIAWQGWRDFALDRWRSIPLAHFAPLASLPGVRLVSLQKGHGSEQVATVDFPILDLSGRLDEVAGPFMDTAAVIRNVDLVVTADTVIAHLAGALGVPVWVALSFSSDWRWLLGREDSPWYPTMRLFRQPAFGAWPDVFERVAKAVQARRSAGGQTHV